MFDDCLRQHSIRSEKKIWILDKANQQFIFKFYQILLHSFIQAILIEDTCIVRSNFRLTAL